MRTLSVLHWLNGGFFFFCSKGNQSSWFAIAVCVFSHTVSPWTQCNWVTLTLLEVSRRRQYDMLNCFHTLNYRPHMCIDIFFKDSRLIINHRIQFLCTLCCWRHHIEASFVQNVLVLKKKFFFFSVYTKYTFIYFYFLPSALYCDFWFRDFSWVDFVHNIIISLYTCFRANIIFCYCFFVM
jgi:hypothetical protein